MRPSPLPVLFLLLCHCGGAIEPAPPPRRPKAKEVATPEPATVQRTDCDPLDPTSELPALKFAERSIEEGQNLADQAFTMLKRAEDRAVPREEQERLIEESVRRFITALSADPYNVHATYNLAAAYARIGRGQCAVNLLERMAAMRRLPSQRGEVEEKLDRLFGRGKWEGRLDPDFFELRDDARFREVVKSLQ
jgi:hypothetical protein